MLQNIRIEASTANQMKTSGLLFLIASFLILLGNLIPVLAIIIIFLVLGLIMILISIGFLISFLVKLDELRPDEKSTFNFTRIGLGSFMLMLIVVNILVFVLVPVAVTLVFAVIQAITQLAGFVGLNISFQKFSRSLDPSHKIDSPAFFLYGGYGIVELTMAIIAAFAGSYGALMAVLWIDLILTFILMIVVGIVLILNTEKLLKYSGETFKSPVADSPDQPSAKYYTTEESKEVIYCQNCGNKILDSDAFCSECGVKR